MIYEASAHSTVPECGTAGATKAQNSPKNNPGFYFFRSPGGDMVWDEKRPLIVGICQNSEIIFSVTQAFRLVLDPDLVGILT